VQFTARAVFTRCGLFNGAFFGALCSVDLLATVEDEVEETGKETEYLDVLFQRFLEWVRHSTKETSEYAFGPRF